MNPAKRGEEWTSRKGVAMKKIKVMTDEEFALRYEAIKLMLSEVDDPDDWNGKRCRIMGYVAGNADGNTGRAWKEEQLQKVFELGFPRKEKK